MVNLKNTDCIVYTDSFTYEQHNILFEAVLVLNTLDPILFGNLGKKINFQENTENVIMI